MIYEVGLTCPFGPFSSSIPVPDGVDVRDSRNRRNIGRLVWQQLCITLLPEDAWKFYAYTGGDPAGWIAANMRLVKR